METDLAQRVRRGALLLDVKYPNWAYGIDLDRLNMATERFCILGQLHGQSYWTGIQKVLDGRQDIAANYGFDIEWNDSGHDFQTLESLWNEEVSRRTVIMNTLAR